MTHHHKDAAFWSLVILGSVAIMTCVVLGMELVARLGGGA